ncbi:MAG: hypothetical protein AMJ90_07635 [candidate division Zixibacteria bacterium SM23_73_2]|nr:MAG: hypothetical protein AMJ90_07635 [candidate division Zixibacteria bacterium SM23_73_2]
MKRVDSSEGGLLKIAKGWSGKVPDLRKLMTYNHEARALSPFTGSACGMTSPGEGNFQSSLRDNFSEKDYTTVCKRACI